MGIFRRKPDRSHLSPSAKKAWEISTRLFKSKSATDADIDALIAIGSEGVKPFRAVLAQDEHRRDVARREQIVDMLGVADKRDAGNLPAIIALLTSFVGDREGMSGYKAISYLADHGEKVGQLLLETLKGGNSRTRRYAARTLGNVSDQQVIPGLIAALKDEDARVRSDAAESLGKLGDAHAIDALIRALADSNWLVRESASDALTRFGDQQTMDNLARLMHSHDHRIRTQAVRIINKIDNRQALPLLLAALDDSHIEVQWAVVGALTQRRDSHALVPLLAHYDRGNKDMRRHITAACDSIGMQRTATHLTNTDAMIRTAVIKILAQHGGSEFLPLLADAWHHESDHDVQMWITIAIGQLAAVAGGGSPGAAIRTLIQATESPHQAVRYHAGKALESLRHPLAEQFLRQPMQQAKVAIACPHCLQSLQLTPPIIGKKWHCQHCSLGFTIRPGADGELVVSPVVVATKAAPPASHPTSWFDVLQVNPDASVAAIKQAFRTLLKQSHPDKVATLGIEFKQLAEEKTRMLTWALHTGLEARQRKR